WRMVVLINQNSGAASEIVAAALQDQTSTRPQRAKVVGQRTYGKGSVQNLFELDDGKSVLKLTVASYYRPSGENIHRFRTAKTSDKWGVSPDPGCEVKLSIREYFRWAEARRDRDLAAGHSKVSASPPEAKKPRAGAAPDASKGDARAKAETKRDLESGPPKRRSPRQSAGP